MESHVNKVQAPLTQEEVLERIGAGWYQLRVLVMTGFLVTAYGMQLQLLPFLTNSICEGLNMSENEYSFASSCFFIGYFFGTFVAGLAADHIGRCRAMLVWMVCSLIGGILVAYSTNLYVLSITMTVTGFGVGGLHPGSALNVEMLPVDYRNIGAIFWQTFWTAGLLLECLFAYLLQDYNWKYLCLATTGMIAVPLLLYPLWDESPRFLAMEGREQAAHRVFEKMARVNGRPEAFQRGTPLVPPSPEDEGELPLMTAMKSMFSPRLLAVTIILWLLWINAELSYDGFMFITGEEHFGGWSVYASTAIIGCAEYPSFVLQWVLGDGFGRRRAFMVLSASLVVIFLEVELLGEEASWIKLVLFFGARLAGTTVQNLLWILTPEVYPTQIRSTGFGTCTAVASLAGIFIPFIAIPLKNYSSWAISGMFIALNAVSFMGAFLLPFETKGRALDAEHVKKQ